MLPRARRPENRGATGPLETRLAARLKRSSRRGDSGASWHDACAYRSVLLLGRKKRSIETHASRFRSSLLHDRTRQRDQIASNQPDRFARMMKQERLRLQIVVDSVGTVAKAGLSVVRLTTRGDTLVSDVRVAVIRTVSPAITLGATGVNAIATTSIRSHSPIVLETHPSFYCGTAVVIYRYDP